MCFEGIKIDLLFARLNPSDFETCTTEQDFEELCLRKDFKWQHLDPQS